MSIFSQTIARDRAVLRSMSALRHGVSSGSISGMDPFAASGVTHTLSGFGMQDLGLAQEQLQHNRGYTYAIIRLIYNRIAGQTLRVARQRMAREAYPRLTTHYVKRYVPKSFHARIANAELLDDHPILDVFNDPNPIMVSPMLWHIIVASLETTGRAFAWVRPAEETNSGQVEIWPWPSSWVQPIHDEEKLFKEWLVQSPSGSEPLRVPGEQMVYWYYPDPSMPLGALSPLQALANSVLADEYVEIAQRVSFKHGPNPSLAITIGRMPGIAGVTDPTQRPSLTKEQRFDILNMIKAQYSGVLNHGMPLLLDQLIQDVKRIDTTPRDMDYMNSGMHTKGRLAQGWGVNLISMGEMENANRASSSVADQHLCDNVLNPRLCLISEVMTRFFNNAKYLCFGRKDEKFLIYLENATSHDVDYELQRDTAMMDRLCKSRNEWRTEHGMPRYKNGDNVYLDGQVVPLEIEDIDRDGEVKEVDPYRPGPVTRKSRTPIAAAKGLAQVLGLENTLRCYDRHVEMRDQQLQPALRDFFYDMGRTLIGQLQPHFRDRPVTAHTLDDLYDVEEWAEKLKECIEAHLHGYSKMGAALAWEFYLPHKDFDLLATKGLLDFTKIPGRLWSAAKGVVTRILNQPYWGEISQRIKDGIATSMSKLNVFGPQEATKVVDEHLGEEAADKHATSIASVEGLSAANGGHQEGQTELHKMGAIRVKTWHTKMDDRVRHAHQEAEGQTVGINEPFTVGGVECMYPLDPVLPIGLRANCRCRALANDAD